MRVRLKGLNWATKRLANGDLRDILLRLARWPPTECATWLAGIRATLPRGPCNPPAARCRVVLPSHCRVQGISRIRHLGTIQLAVVCLVSETDRERFRRHADRGVNRSAGSRRVQRLAGRVRGNAAQGRLCLDSSCTGFLVCEGSGFDHGEPVRAGWPAVQTRPGGQTLGRIDIADLFKVAGPPIQLAATLALWTGQRQGDLLRLPWSAYDGKYIRLRQGKNRSPGRGAGRRAPAGRTRPRTARHSTLVLTNSRGRPWTSDGFRTSWGKACAKAGITGLTFHDLRGSAVVRLAIADATVPQIATLTGHSLKDVEAILDAHYLGARCEACRDRDCEARSRNEFLKPVSNRAWLIDICSS